MKQETLAYLSACNKKKVHAVDEEAFCTYGRVVTGYDFSELFCYMEHNTDIPENGNIYVPSAEGLEDTKVKAQLEAELYGGLPIQIGYCNGRNTTYNGFEYHKCSEINIAVTDFILVLGHIWDMNGFSYDTSQPELFYVEKGTAIEMYQTTLHLSPCRVNDEGFKDIVVLAKGTNMPRSEGVSKTEDAESEILLQTNKWIIAHPDREPLIRQGAVARVTGDNIEVRYGAESE